MHLLGWILTSIGGFSLLGDLWTEFTKRKLDQLYIGIFVVIPSLSGMILLSLSKVDLFASLWGPHVWWKLIPAALIFALFWPIVLGAMQHIKSKRVRWLGSVWFLLVFGPLLVLVVIEWIKYPASLNLPPEVYQTFPWLSIHPSLAVYHLYANATYLGAWEIMGASFVVGEPIAKRLAELLGSNKRAVLLNALVFIAGIITQVITK